MYICPRCQGNGTIEKYKHVENGICFECSGSGKVTEEERQRIEKDILREFKKIQTNKQVLINSLKKQWFNNSDIIYIVDNSNTYSIKEQLKQDGAFFNNGHKVWYFKEQNSKYPLFKIEWQEVLNDNGIGYAVNLQHIIKTRSKDNLKGY